jgi:hypothetical protein
MEDREISVIVRVMPDNEDVEVTLPLNATATDVLESLFESGIGKRSDQQGNPVIYRLVPKGKDVAIGENQSLGEAQVQNADTLLMMPELVAG